MPTQRPPRVGGPTLYNVGLLLGRLEGVRVGDIVAHQSPRGTPPPDGPVLLLVGSMIHELEMFQLFPRELGDLIEVQRSLRNNRNGGIIRPLQADEERRLKMAVGRVRALAETELGRIHLFDFTPEDGTLDYGRVGSQGATTLVDDPHVLEALPPETRADLDDSVNALSRGLPTAAAMLALRAAEGIVRQTHARLGAAAPSREDWFNFADEIVKVLPKETAETSALSGYLTFMRSERNRAQHPGARFTTREAEQAVLNAVRMAVLLRSISAKAA